MNAPIKPFTAASDLFGTYQLIGLEDIDTRSSQVVANLAVVPSHRAEGSRCSSSHHRSGGLASHLTRKCANPPGYLASISALRATITLNSKMIAMPIA